MADTDFETGEYDVGDFADELEGERNHDIGTKVLLENDRVRVWEIRLEPGDRVPFHWHTTTYLFVCGISVTPRRVTCCRPGTCRRRRQPRESSMAGLVPSSCP